jgi:hypothetical protein
MEGAAAPGAEKPKLLFADADVPEFEECAASVGLWIWCIEDFGLGKCFDNAWCMVPD